MTDIWLHNTIEYIKKAVRGAPGIGVILGSGLTGFINRINISCRLDYADIPGMQPPSVKGHGGSLIFGKLGNTPIVCASGRFHLYEGLDLKNVVLPVRIFKELGVETIIITNSSGCLKKEWNIGSFMLISSILDFTFQEKVQDPSPVYIRSNKFDELVKQAHASAEKIGMKLNEGCYAWTSGPSYETHAEVKKIIEIKGNAVGMSTLPEIRESIKENMTVLGIACLTNYAAGIHNKPLTHHEVVSKAKVAEKSLTDLIEKLVYNCNIQT